jgi:GH24 family phage-related lysozyme (muramidase)
MACGTFPVVSRTVSNEAWLKDGVTSLMFDCGNAAQLAEQLERAMRDRDLRLSAARLNRQVVEDRGDRERNMLELESRYFDVVAARTAGGEAPRHG